MTGIINRLMLYHGAQVDLGANYDGCEFDTRGEPKETRCCDWDLFQCNRGSPRVCPVCLEMAAAVLTRCQGSSELLSVGCVFQ